MLLLAARKRKTNSNIYPIPRFLECRIAGVTASYSVGLRGPEKKFPHHFFLGKAMPAILSIAKHFTKT